MSKNKLSDFGKHTNDVSLSIYTAYNYIDRYEWGLRGFCTSNYNVRQLSMIVPVRRSKVCLNNINIHVPFGLSCVSSNPFIHHGLKEKSK